MNESQKLFHLANNLLASSQLELNECRTHTGEYARDSWVACMVTSRILGRMASALIALRDELELEKENAPSEADPPKFQPPSNAGSGGGNPESGKVILLHSEGGDPPAA